MNTLAAEYSSELVALTIESTDDMICLVLSDGREVKTALPQMTDKSSTGVQLLPWNVAR